MGPVEITFLVIVVIWGAIGIVRGYPKELGVTLMLFIGLFVLVFIDARLCNQFMRLMAFIAGPDPYRQATLKTVIYCLFLVFMVFISYQGDVLAYPARGKSSFISWLVGLLNGYLFAGSVWYYLALAQWPFGLVRPPFTPFYDALSKILPPEVFSWLVLIGLIVIMLILKVIK